MSTHVYANGLEISSQAADGIASVAFPDPCWSPPAPPAGPVVIPYPNTARPGSLKNGSCTVFICGKPVALEDHSYFSTSTGNEAATQAFGKGVATGVIKGKAFHRSWSMNVMIEGRGVARHTDLMTHNHGGAIPGNTPMFPYLSRKAPTGPTCQEEKKQIKENCAPVEGQHWTDTYCNDAQFMLHTLIKNSEVHKELTRVRTRIPEVLAAKHPAQFEDLRKRAVDFEKEAARFQEVTDLATDEGRKTAKALTTEGQGMLATLNDCTRALKCRLVPYDSEEDTAAHPKENEKTRGCCKGQTGHHLIYDVMVKKEPGEKERAKGKGGECSKYNKKDAPTVCVEGANNHHGTHGAIHSKMDEIVVKIATQGYLDVDDKKKYLRADGQMDLELAVDAAATSHAETFPTSGCSRACIKAQLNDYYGKICPNGTFATVNKNGKPHKPLSGDEPFV